MSRAGFEKGGVRQKPDVDHAYNLPRLHRMFFWSALASLLSMIVWVVIIDYDKPWKRHQREFMRMSAEQTRAAIAGEDKRLSGGSGKKKLEEAEAALAAAGGELKSRQAELDAEQKRLQKAEARFYKADQATRTAKALYDAFRYEFEATRHAAEEGHAGHDKVEKAQRQLEDLNHDRAAAALAFEQATAERDSAAAELARLTAARDAAQQGYDALFASRRRLEARLETLEPSFVNVVRNSPVMDFISPSIQVQQIVLEDLRFDVNYQTIPRVDRCKTCHLGIDKEGFEEAPQPYRTHPNLELLMAAQSPHPADDVGCTVCHDGWDRATNFKWAAHYPDSEEKRHAWEKEHGWHPLHKWDNPMLPGKYVQGQCLKCHKDEIYLAGAPILNQGREIFERAGCWGCHKVDGKLGPKVGPTLRSLVSKTERDWVRRWIEDPVGFRPTTLMPAAFNQSNTNDETWQRRNDLEVEAITEYLFARSKPEDLLPLPRGPGDPERGRALVETVGCKACHLVGETAPPTTAHIRQRFGPNLMGMAAKTSAQWVFNWIKDPKRINPETRMPGLRLTDREALDITAYLMDVPAPAGFGSQPLPQSPAALRDEVTLEYLRNNLSQKQAEIRLAAMSDAEKTLFLGEKLIGRYGCYGCHDIPGFEKAEAIGVELTGEGSKILAKFDFGLVHEVPHTRWGWIANKVRDPRVWDRGLVKGPQDKLRMPRFNFSEDEIDAVTAFVLGLTKDQIPATKRKVYDPHELARNAGMRIVADRNCLACHRLESFGGDYEQLVADVSLAPPLITPTGAKVQPEWLIDFLHAPSAIRPWLDVRMPTFGFDDAQVATLVGMFQGISRVDDRYPRFDAAQATPASIQRGRAQFGVRGAPGFDASLKCNACHPAGNVLPTSPQTQWGPNLGMAHERLRPAWVVDWLRNPQAIQPGTRMPNFFYDGDTPLTEDPERDMLDLRNYMWTLREAGAGRRASLAEPEAEVPMAARRR